MAYITFEAAAYLWFLFAVPLLVIAHLFFLRHTKRKAMKFANFAALKRVTGKRIITKNYTVLFLRAGIILCAVLAVAQATLWYEGNTNSNEYVIAIDTSASMTTADMDPTRLDAAKEYAANFIDKLDANTRVGLVSFSGVTFIEEPLTLDREALKESLNGIFVEAAGTDLPGAIITSVNTLVAAEKGKSLILISDGSNTIETIEGKGIVKASNYAKASHVKIYTVGVGTADTSPIGYLPTVYNISASYNEDNLKFIANATGGKYYTAADASSLEAAYNDIMTDEHQSELKIDLTKYFMLLCLILLLAEWFLSNTRYRMLP